VRKAINIESGGRDPLENTPYTYLRFKDKKSVQLMGYFENTGWELRLSLRSNFGIQDAHAADYIDRYPVTLGKKLGVFIDCTNKNPLHEVSSYTASGVNLGLTSINTGIGICVIGNTESNINETLSATGVLARVFSPASLIVASSGGPTPTAPFICGTSTVAGRAPDSTVYQTVTGADGKCWIKSNLGTANVATSSTDSTAYGWYYQWGRLTDGHQIPTSATV
jgi:hypothetical protein